MIVNIIRELDNEFILFCVKYQIYFEKKLRNFATIDIAHIIHNRLQYSKSVTLYNKMCSLFIYISQ